MDRADIEKTVRNAVLAALGGKAKQTEQRMSLELANRLIRIVRERAKEKGMRVVTAVCDEGARPVSVQSMDGAYIASYDVALNKAYTSVSLKMSTAQLGELAQPGADLYGVQFTNGGQIVIFGGGQPLYLGGRLVGGLGISGGTLKQDTELAEYGKRKWEELVCRSMKE